MKLSKKSLVAAFAIASVAGASVFATSAFAHSDLNAADSLASKIATKFNLDQAEVKDALDEFREEQRAEFEAKFNARLDQAVTDGDLTQEQKDMILAKRDEVKPRLDEIRDIENKEERQQAMKELRDELKTWAEDNDIPLRWLGGAGIHAEAHAGIGLHLGDQKTPEEEPTN